MTNHIIVNWYTYMHIYLSPYTMHVIKRINGISKITNNYFEFALLLRYTLFYKYNVDNYKLGNTVNSSILTHIHLYYIMYMYV